MKKWFEVVLLLKNSNEAFDWVVSSFLNLEFLFKLIQISFLFALLDSFKFFNGFPSNIEFLLISTAVLWYSVCLIGGCSFLVLPIEASLSAISFPTIPTCALTFLIMIPYFLDIINSTIFLIVEIWLILSCGSFGFSNTWVISWILDCESVLIINLTFSFGFIIKSFSIFNSSARFNFFCHFCWIVLGVF